MTDPKQLIQRYCRERDTAACRFFYKAQADRLWRFLVARGCDAESAYDLVSEAFLRFFKTICRDPSEPVAYLYRIAINLCTDARRRRQTQAVDPSAAVENLPDENAAQTEEHAVLIKKINTLPDDEQNLLLMRYWLGFSHKEIAAALDRPEGTVRRQCVEAIDKLRRDWGEET